MADDELIVDLTNYKDRVGNRVLPGRYTVIVEDAEKDTSSNNNPMCNLWLRVQGGEFDGATIVDRITLTEKSMFRVVGFMQAIGLPTPKKRLKVNTRVFVGKRLEIDVEDGEPYLGRIKSEVRGYMRIMGGGNETVADLDDVGADEPTDISAFTGEAQAEAAAATATTEAAPEAPAPAEPESDVIDLDEIDLS